MRISFAGTTVGIAALLWLLVQMKEVLQPLLIALVCWFLIGALARQFSRVIGGGREARGPSLAAKLLSVLTVVGAAVLLSMSAVSNLEALQANLPLYETNVKAKLAALNDALGLGLSLDYAALLGSIDASSLALTLAGGAVGSLAALTMIIVYTIFLFSEEAIFPRKLDALRLSADGRSDLTATLVRARDMIEVYFGVKCIIGLVQAVPTFLVLWALDVDAPAFWAVLIFVLSFIPTIGSLVGIAFPSLLALVQFPDSTPFLITLVCLGLVQVLASNWLEPKLTSNSLDLSPLVVLLGVFAGAAIWGIVGAFIAVPLLSILMIVFANIDSLRPVAVLMSGGQTDVGAPSGTGEAAAEPVPPQ